MAERELVQLIDDLGKLRAKADEVRAGQHSENELPQMLIAGALTTFGTLSIARSQAANPGDPADAARKEELNGQLAGALHAIKSRGYSVEAIDEAISVARSQM
jgi:hypothetical protein